MKPAIVSAGYNTEIRTFCNAGANTIIIESQVADASTQTESTVSYSDAGTMTNNKDDETVVTLFSIEQTKDDDKIIRFYTGFPSFQLLMICFKFLCAAVSNLSYRDHLKLLLGTPLLIPASNYTPPTVHTPPGAMTSTTTALVESATTQAVISNASCTATTPPITATSKTIGVGIGGVTRARPPQSQVKPNSILQLSSRHKC